MTLVSSTPTGKQGLICSGQHDVRMQLILLVDADADADADVCSIRTDLYLSNNKAKDWAEVERLVDCMSATYFQDFVSPTIYRCP
jgi:hypothetical protein